MSVRRRRWCDSSGAHHEGWMIDVQAIGRDGRLRRVRKIATRYANGHSEGAPFEHYSELQTNEAIRYATEIVEFVRARLADPGTRA